MAFKMGFKILLVLFTMVSLSFQAFMCQLGHQNILCLDTTICIMETTGNKVLQPHCVGGIVSSCHDQDFQQFMHDMEYKVFVDRIDCCDAFFVDCNFVWHNPKSKSSVSPTDSKKKTSFWDKIKETVKNGADNIKSVGKNLVSKVKEGADAAKDKIGDVITKAKSSADNARDKIHDGISHAKTSADDAKEKITKGIGDATSIVGNVRDKITQGKGDAASNGNDANSAKGNEQKVEISKVITSKAGSSHSNRTTKVNLFTSAFLVAFISYGFF